ncbi:MAG: tRNA pseudouridine(55) synthase TruB [Desulfovibrio sp.]|jgi:tRNA pseudouridine55 synthase|nr:tRNA pseudouridine(55) synthase TruB [Desulfovibrio sp.]
MDKTIRMSPPQDGVLVLNKAGGPTSADCLRALKRGLGLQKIGHAGTLDPMAEGVLLVLLGQATKISGPLLDAGEKVYSGIILLGVVTDTWDAEGRVVERHPVKDVDDARIKSECAFLVGTYEQEIPAYSAAKYHGRPRYESARKGIEIPAGTKPISVYRCRAELVGPERIAFRVTCGSGTYIRSLAHSLGKRLGCGGTLEQLTREYSRPFGLAQAHTLEDVLEHPEDFPSKLKSIADALPDCPHVRLSREDARIVRYGGKIRCPVAADSFPAEGLPVLMLDPDGKALALGVAEPPQGTEAPVLRVARGLWNA